MAFRGDRAQTVLHAVGRPLLISSLLCGLASNLTLLIVAGAIQGLGGGGIGAEQQAMLANSFPPSTRAQAFAVYGVAVIVAPAFGPTIGGYITDNDCWHWIFFINVPIGALALALVAAIVDEPFVLIRDRKALGGGACASTGSDLFWLRFGSGFWRSCSIRDRRTIRSILPSSPFARSFRAFPSSLSCLGNCRGAIRSLTSGDQAASSSARLSS